MANKISGYDPRSSPVSGGAAVPRPRDATAGAPGERGAEAKKEVRITGEASRLAALEQALIDGPAVDEARVAEIRSAIEEGRYTVDAERTAEHLILTERALLELGEAQEK